MVTDYFNVKFYHGTIKRTEITCKKIHCYMHDSTCRWLIVKHFLIFPRERNCKILIGLHQ